MKISLVTVVLNGVETIANTLQSIQGQSHPDIEHIIIDGGSSDGTLDVITPYSARIATVISEPDEGLYHAMNKGISLATGEVVGTLNADDFYAHDNVLKRVAKTFADPDIEACYADLLYVDADDTNKVIRYWTSQPYQDGLFERGWIPAHPTFFVRRDVYDRCGLFDLKMKYQSDFELTMRFLAINKIKSAYVPEIWVKMRTGGTTNRSVANVIRGNLESYRACKELGLKVTPMYFVTKALMRLPQFFKRPYPAGIASK